MTTQNYPQLDEPGSEDTRNALHAYARILGDWLKSCRPKRKHWWHASLRPSLNGMTTGVVHSGVDFELELNLRQSLLCGHTSHGAEFTTTLEGQAAGDVAKLVRDFLLANGLNKTFDPAQAGGDEHAAFAGYSPEHASRLAIVLNSVSAAMVKFRAGIPDETSPVQLWPHHFDLSMIWLPGEKIPGQDPQDEENSDKQMNFGFTFGDAGIPEPYFYITAYPFEEGLLRVPLPAGTEWRTEPFSAAVLPYATLLESDDPTGYLLDLWTDVLSAGRKHMLNKSG